MKVKGPRKLVKRAKFAAAVLGVDNFHLDIRFAKDDEHSSECLLYSNGDFLIVIESDIPKCRWIEHVAHEMVHLRQHKHDQLLPIGDGSTVFWEGEKHIMSEGFDDAYFLSPWEMEARGLEAFVEWKWRHR